MKLKISAALLLCIGLSRIATADLYMVTTTEGPGFASNSEAAAVLENGILPLFDQLLALQADKRIVAGGLPVGSRTLYLIVEADSNAEVDQMLRDLGAWGVFSWTVTPLQTLRGRAQMERDIVKQIKSGM